ncbi:DUF1559 domain-containing protein [Stieleria sp. JC731]|uniref:DUF1559 domain-containing protein n=1 Tax=Pirellulaceae TaxID=2691357 RepID=UPI001E39E3D9|nr:DUF1559 domain-containing protein [Stieleria sp. JC731]MCC9600921.1 DUF1559 domain-containing protein [Stieleria sp. JC731]
MKRESNRPANALAMLIFGLILVAMLPRQLISQRESTRSSVCADHLREITSGLHNYSNAFKRLPPGTGGTWSGQDPSKSNQGRLGPLVGLLPFIGHTKTWEIIASPLNTENGMSFPPMGPTPTFNPERYPPWAMAPEVYLCPTSASVLNRESQVVTSLREPERKLTVTSYVACFGDSTTMQGEILDLSDPLMRDLVRQRNASNRGMFVTGRSIRLSDCTDGLSNTVIYSETIASLRRLDGQSEIVRNVQGLSKQPSLCIEAAQKEDRQFWKFGRGARWSDGWPLLTGFQTVLPPNSPSCTSPFGAIDPVVSASSLHPDGVHIALADGAVRFITDRIDTGDLDVAGVASGEGYAQPDSESPYGLWGAIGSRNAGEIVPNGLPDIPEIKQQSEVADDLSNTDELYSWTDHQSGDELSAKFIEIRDQTTVRLKHQSGSIHEVPLNSLAPSEIVRAVELDLIRKAAMDSL